MSPTVRRQAGRPAPGRPDPGFSLVEVLLASALLLVVVVSIVPLFTRSLSSNAAGGRASAMSTFAMENLEEANQGTVDHPYWEIGGTLSSATMTGNVLDFGKEYWSVAAEGQLGDEGWQEDTTGGGLFLWERSIKMRKFTYADVLPGNLDVTGSGLTALGHPELYDSPLGDESGPAAKTIHLLEIRVTIQPHTGLPLSQGQQMTVGHYRTF